MEIISRYISLSLGWHDEAVRKFADADTGQTRQARIGNFFANWGEYIFLSLHFINLIGFIPAISIKFLGRQGDELEIQNM